MNLLAHLQRFQSGAESDSYLVVEPHPELEYFHIATVDTDKMEIRQFREYELVSNCILAKSCISNS